MRAMTVQNQERRVKKIALGFGNGTLIYLDITSKAVLGQLLALVTQRLLDGEPETANHARPYLRYIGAGLMYVSLVDILLYKYSKPTAFKLLHMIWSSINQAANTFIFTEIVALIIYLLIKPQNSEEMSWDDFIYVTIGPAFLAIMRLATSMISNLSGMLRRNDHLRIGSYYIDTKVFDRTIFNPVFNIPKTLLQIPLDIPLWAGVVQMALELLVFQFLPDTEFYNVIQYSSALVAGGALSSLHPLNLFASIFKLAGKKSLEFISDHIEDLLALIAAIIFEYDAMQAQFGQDSQTSNLQKGIITGLHGLLMTLPILFLLVLGLPKQRPLQCEDRSTSEEIEDQSESSKLHESKLLLASEKPDSLPMPDGTSGWLARHGIHKEVVLNAHGGLENDRGVENSEYMEL
ncbi:MAG: hypothetical protein AB7F64_07230 [Gammaproteobacteria bacterium]